MTVDLLFAARNSRAAMEVALGYLEERLGDPAVRAALQASIAVQDAAIAGDAVREIDPHVQMKRN